MCFVKRQTIKVFVFILFASTAFSQKTITHQNLYWLRYNNQLKISSKISILNEIENRRFFIDNRQHHFISHSRIQYNLLPNVDVAAGICFSRQSPQNEYSTSNLVVPEIRPEQEFLIQTPLSKKISLLHRIRFDERFIRKNNGNELLEGHEFNMRFRYRLQLGLKLSSDESKYPFQLKLANELMLNDGKNIVYNQFDQNRASVAVEKTFSKNIAAELSYIHWYQQRNTGVDFYSRNIYRFTLTHKINLSKSVSQ